MRSRLLHPVASAAALLLLAGSTAASDGEVEPTEPPLGPPVVYDDQAGDVPQGTPDLISCSVSEPFESLVRFELGFATDPPLSYDLETWTTDELWLVVSSKPDSAELDDFEYALIVHGATLPEAAVSGSGLYDTTATEGNEVFWGVVDVAVDGPRLALTVDRKLLGDPDELAFYAWATTEGQDEPDSCPDEAFGPGTYRLLGK